MNRNIISLLQKKHPGKILAALDHRSAEYRQSVNSKDIALSTDMVRARKSRSRDTITLCRFDQELEVLFSIVGSTLYYMPTATHQHLSYKVNVCGKGGVLETVAEMARVAVYQSLQEQGSMKPGETRVFVVVNEQQTDYLSHVHLTIFCNLRSYHVAAELGESDSGLYTSLLSFGLPKEHVRCYIA